MRCLPVTSYGFQKLQVFCLYITGHLNTVFPAEFRKEILRYIYYHQVHIFGSFYKLIVMTKLELRLNFLPTFLF